MLLHTLESSYVRLRSCIFRARKTSLNQFKLVFVGLYNFPKLEDQRPDRSYGLDRS